MDKLAHLSGNKTGKFSSHKSGILENLSDVVQLTLWQHSKIFLSGHENKFSAVSAATKAVI